MNVSRDMKRQEVAGYQLDLFKGQRNPACHGVTGDGRTESGAFAVRQVSSAVDEQRALTQDLMDRVAGLANLEEAVRRVCKNKGAAGADGMSTRELKKWFPSHWRELQEQMLDGTYQATEVLGVEIPKPSGGVRKLGIPTVVDRVVQQALLQQLRRAR